MSTAVFANESTFNETSFLLNDRSINQIYLAQSAPSLFFRGWPRPTESHWPQFQSWRRPAKEREREKWVRFFDGSVDPFIGYAAMKGVELSRLANHFGLFPIAIEAIYTNSLRVANKALLIPLIFLLASRKVDYAERRGQKRRRVSTPHFISLANQKSLSAAKSGFIASLEKRGKLLDQDD